MISGLGKACPGISVYLMDVKAGEKKNISRETIKENSGSIGEICRSGFRGKIFTGTREPVLSLLLSLISEAKRNIPVSYIKEGQAYSRQRMRKHPDSRTENEKEILKEKSGGKKKQKDSRLKDCLFFEKYFMGKIPVLPEKMKGLIFREKIRNQK